MHKTNALNSDGCGFRCFIKLKKAFIYESFVALLLTILNDRIGLVDSKSITFQVYRFFQWYQLECVKNFNLKLIQ